MITNLTKKIFGFLVLTFALTGLAFAQDSAGPRTAKTPTKTNPTTTSTPKPKTNSDDNGDSILKPKTKTQTQTQTKSETPDGLIFPEVEGWSKGEKTTYPVIGLGYSYTYKSSKGGVVTIYVYDKRLSQIPDGINNSAVKDEFKSVKGELSQLGKAGVFQNLKEAKSETVNLIKNGGKVKSLYALFYFDLRGESMASEVYIFGYKNNFIKVRATRPKSAENSTELTELLGEFDTMFGN